MRRLAPLLVALALGCEKAKPTGSDPVKGDGPNPAGAPAMPLMSVPGMFPPANWSHKELAEYLAQKGVKVEALAIPQYSAQDQPAASFTSGSGRVIVYLCPGEQSAREKAGALGDGAFSAGRFALGGTSFGSGRDPNDAELLARIRAALK